MKPWHYKRWSGSRWQPWSEDHDVSLLVQTRKAKQVMPFLSAESEAQRPFELMVSRTIGAARELGKVELGLVFAP